MMGMELVAETSIFNQLTRLIAREYFINEMNSMEYSPSWEANSLIS
jgi:hypothetical protein